MNINEIVRELQDKHHLSRSAAEELALKSLATAQKKQKIKERLEKRKATNYLEFLNDSSPELDWDTPMAAYLAGVVDQVIEGKILNAVVSISPRAGKSELITKRLPVYWLETRPRDKVIIGAYNHTFARSFTSSALKLYKERNPSDIDMETEEEWSNVYGGSVFAVGVGSGVTGRGTSLTIIDDPVKSIAEAFSKSYRDRVWNWYINDLRTRRNNLATTPTIVIATRWHCILPKCGIITDMGIKNMETIAEGQTVLTSAGPQTVLASRSKDYCGDIINLRVFGYPKALRLTPEHRILTNDGWVEAGNLKVGDFVTFPIPYGETSMGEIRGFFPAPQESRASAHTGMTGAKNKVDKENFIRLLESGMTYEQVAQAVGFAGKSTVGRYAKLWGVARSNHNVIKGDILNDLDFWNIVGLWLAEGTITYGRKGAPNVVRFTLGYHEEEKAIFVRDVMARYGISVRYNKVKRFANALCGEPKRESSSINVTFSSTQVAEFLSLFGKGALNKFMPEWAILLPIPFAQKMIDGYLGGDGFVDGTDTARIASSSMSLMISFQRLLLRLGIISQIMNGPRDDAYELRFRAYDAEWMGIPKRKRRKWSAAISDNKLNVMVKSTSREHYEGIVYDIQTPCHDFLGHGMTIHNCDDLIGRILEQFDPGEWLNICIPAIAEVNDPLGRQVGESINPIRLPLKELEREKRLMGPRFDALYQGHPINEAGALFNVEKFGDPIDEVPIEAHRVRFWDRAASADGGDWTVGALLAYDSNGLGYVEDIIRERLSSDAVRTRMKQTLVDDIARYGKIKGYTFKTYFEREPAGDGKTAAEGIIRAMAPYPIYWDRPTDNKTARSAGYAVAVNAGNIKLKKGPWLRDFINEHIRFVPDADNKQDDQCFVAGTMIYTHRGPISIENIRADDYVLTRSGYKRVLCSRMTSKSTRVISAILSNGERLTGTPNHPVFIQNGDISRLDTISGYGIIHVCEYQTRLYTKVSHFVVTLTRKVPLIGTIIDLVETMYAPESVISIKRFGKIILGQFLADTKFTTRTETRSITQSIISNVSPRRNTRDDMSRWDRGKTTLPSKRISTRLENSRRSGTHQKRDELGMSSMERMLGVSGSQLSGYVRFAEKTLRLFFLAARLGFVLTCARTGKEQDREEDSRRKSVRSAGRNILAIRGKKAALVHVLRVEDGNEQRAVYNLTISGSPEYFANGVLVHNCDAAAGAYNKLAIENAIVTVR